MRVAVTGGSGKAGRAVVTDLGARDHDVVDLDLRTSLTQMLRRPSSISPIGDRCSTRW